MRTKPGPFSPTKRPMRKTMTRQNSSTERKEQNQVGIRMRFRNSYKHSIQRYKQLGSESLFML